MQTIHKVCLILTGACVLLICVGIGIGIAHSGKSDLNDTIIEYEAYDEDYYVDYESPVVNTATVDSVKSVRYGTLGGDRGVIEAKHQEEGIRD